MFCIFAVHSVIYKLLRHTNVYDRTTRYVPKGIFTTICRRLHYDQNYCDVDEIKTEIDYGRAERNRSTVFKQV